jgi:hypothetical protein
VAKQLRLEQVVGRAAQLTSQNRRSRRGLS